MSPRSEDFMAEARKRLKVAKVDLDAGYPADAASRAYYAMLYAARAALSERDRFAKTHRGAWTLFAELFVKSGLVDERWSEVAAKARDIREGGDYDASEVDAEDAAKLIEEATRFVETIERVLE